MKRRPIELNTNLENFSQHFNQLQFTGIIQSENFLSVDQLSLRDAKNVYIDENLTLVSRSPIVPETLPTNYIGQGSIVPPNHSLVDLYEAGEAVIYVAKHNTLTQYQVSVLKGNQLIIMPETVEQYHISILAQYIIVFNNVDARVLNINEPLQWQLLRDLAEIPVTRRVAGQVVAESPGNQFTSSYKEAYLWSDSAIAILPEGDAEVVVNQAPNNLTWTLPNARLNVEFRILRSMGIEVGVTDLVTVATNETTAVTVIAVARNDHAMLSIDDGQTFNRLLYPANTGFLNIASVSKDGLCFFFVAQDGVYRYEIGDQRWTAIRIETPGIDNRILGVGSNNMCSFNNAEVFSFVTYAEDYGQPVPRLYWKAPDPMVSEDSDLPEDYEGPLSPIQFTELGPISNPLTQLTGARRDLANTSIFVTVTGAFPFQRTTIAAWLPGLSPSETILAIVLDQGEDEPYVVQTHSINRPYGAIYSMEPIYENPNIALDHEFRGIELTGLTVENGTWFKITLLIGKQIILDPDEDEDEDDDEDDEDDDPWANATEIVQWTFEREIELSSDLAAPINLQTAHILDLIVYSIDGASRLPTHLNGELWPGNRARHSTTSDGRYFYIVLGATLYTNKMLEENNATITFTRLSAEPYVEIPHISHSNGELYLGFDNIVKVTSNLRDGIDLKFNLPEINNHVFTSSVNGILNISSTEVAMFLQNKIYLVIQMPDEIFGYRYDYHLTRLTTGIRQGDNVINTRDGMFTLFPTPQGLAVMNYQALMATTDQVVEYTTRNIARLWAEFYRASSSIQLLQMRDYVFLTNGTTQYLMLDLRGMTWWRFESPIPITKLLTDQFDLRLLSKGLYKYDITATNYRDLRTRHIDWRVLSQPLHFSAPGHYKNLRQLIFKLEEATNLYQTFEVQIQLFRRRLLTTPTEIINFKAEGHRTFVRRFNYWKVNEAQWAIAADAATETPAQLRLNGLIVKFEISDEVR